MKFSYLWDWFEYFLKKYARPKRKFEIKPHSTFFVDGAAQSHVEASIISTNFPSSSYLTTLLLPSDVEDHAHTPVYPSNPSNITSLNFRTDLVVNPSSPQMNYFL